METTAPLRKGGIHIPGRFTTGCSAHSCTLAASQRTAQHPMAISGLSKSEFEEIMRHYVRPSDPIDSYEHLVGRAKQRESIEEAINSPGRHIFIYGDRGGGQDFPRTDDRS